MELISSGTVIAPLSNSWRDHHVRSTSDEAHSLRLDQLTAYQLAEPDAQQVALCVLVRTKEPRIDWHLSARQPTHLAEYLAKADLVGRAITAGHFYKRPGKWCVYCDYLAVCLGDQEKVRETLVQVAPRS